MYCIRNALRNNIAVWPRVFSVGAVEQHTASVTNPESPCRIIIFFMISLHDTDSFFTAEPDFHKVHRYAKLGLWARTGTPFCNAGAGTKRLFFTHVWPVQKQIRCHSKLRTPLVLCDRYSHMRSYLDCLAPKLSSVVMQRPNHSDTCKYG